MGADPGWAACGALDPRERRREHLPAFTSTGRFTPLDLTSLPLGLRREFAWSVAGIIARGGLVPLGPLSALARHLPTLLEDRQRREVSARSLMDLSPGGWEREFQRLALKLGRPELALKSARGTLRRIYKPLWIAYEQRRWWQREAWDPRLDARRFRCVPTSPTVRSCSTSFPGAALAAGRSAVVVQG